MNYIYVKTGMANFLILRTTDHTSLLYNNEFVNKFIVKFIDNVIVVIANYIFSKWLIFKDNRDIADK